MDELGASGLRGVLVYLTVYAVTKRYFLVMEATADERFSRGSRQQYSG